MALRAMFLCVLVGIFAGTIRAAGPESYVVLNEVMYDPAGSDLLNEFIELFNISETDPADLTGWEIGEPEYTDAIVASEGAPILGPRQYAVVLDPDYGDSSHTYDPFPSGALRLTVANRSYLGRQGLSNTTPETIVLMDGQGQVVASHTYAVGNKEGRSEERISPYDGSWVESERENGTPGERNSVAQVGIVRVSDRDISIGKVAGVPLRVLGANDLFMLDLELAFNPSVVRFVSIETDGFLKQGGVPVALVDTVLSYGRVKLAMCRLGIGAGGAYGDGPFAIAYFRMIGEESWWTSLKVERVRLRDSSLRLLFSESHSAVLSVPIIRATRVSPPDGAVNVIATAPVRATFDGGPAAPLTGSAFFLDAGERVPGALEYDGASYTATLTPDDVLRSDAIYAATLTRSIGLANDFTWSFTTSILGDIFDLDDPRDENPYDDYLGDGWVDGDDLAVLGYFYGSTPEGTRWNVLPDLTRDRIVDEEDLAALARMYGRKSVHWRGSTRPVSEGIHRRQETGRDPFSPTAPGTFGIERPKVYLRYDPRMVVEGDRIEVTADVEAARALYALHIDLRFDRGAFELDTVKGGPLLGGEPHLALVHRDTQKGLSIGITKLGPVRGVAGTGCAVKLCFTARRNTRASFSLSHTAFISDDLSVCRSSERDRETATYSPSLSSGPPAFELSQNRPNPFNRETEIRYALPHRAYVTLRVYNATGRLICALVDGRKDPGVYAVRWNADDVSSGPYFCRLEADHLKVTRKMMVLK